MKNTTLVKILLLNIALLFAFSGNVSSQVLIEDFNYPIGDLLINHNWIAHSGTDNPIAVTNGLSFAGYAGSGIGGAASVSNNYQDVSNIYTPITSGTVYVAFLFQTGASNAAGYFLHLANSSTSNNTFQARVFVNASGTAVGINETSATPTNTIAVTPGITYLGVIEHNLTTHYSNLYVFNSFPTTQPTTGYVTSTVLNSQNIEEIGRICLRQYNANQDIIVDGIRIATTWADAVAGTNTNATALPAFSVPSGLLYAPTQVEITCSTPGAIIRYTLDGSDPDENSTLYSTPIPINVATTIKAKAWTTGMDASSINTATYTFPIEVPNIAAFLSANSATNSTIYKINNDVTVVFQNGSNTYLTDGTAGIVVYSNQFPSPLTNGQVISGGIYGSYTLYNNLPEFIPAQIPTNIVQGTPVLSTTVTMDELISNYDDYMSQLVTIENVTFSQDTFGTGNNGNVNIFQNNNTMICRNQYGTLTNYITNADTAYNITGMVIIYANSIQIAPRDLNDIVAASTAPTLSIVSPTENATFTTFLDTFFLDLDINHFSVGTDGFLKIESPVLTAMGLSNPYYFNNLNYPLLETIPISLPSGNYTITFSLTDMNHNELTPNVSAEVHFSFVAPTLPVPVFTPAAGTFHEAIQIEVSSSIEGATLYYTLDGSTPTNTSLSTSSPLSLNIANTTTVSIMSAKTGWNNSPIATATYNIIYDPDITITPNTLTFNEMQETQSLVVTGHHLTQNISISCNNNHFTTSTQILPANTSDTTITVTFVGNEPETAQIVFISGTATDTVDVNASLTVEAPVFTPSSTIFNDDTTISISCATLGASIYYTIDGSIPTISSLLYSQPITINQTTHISAIAIKANWTNSAIISETYTLHIPTLAATPTVNPIGGEYSTSQNVELSCATNNATIRYTLDGSTPTVTSTIYSAPIVINSTTTLKAIAWAPGYLPSEEMTAHYQFPTQVDNIAAFITANAIPTNDTYVITGDLTFVYRNAKNIYVQDNTGGLLIFDQNNVISTQYIEGDVISGGVFGKFVSFNGLTEMVPTQNTAAATTNTGVVTPTLTSAFEIGENYNAFESKLVKLDQVIFSAGSFTTTSSSNISFTDDDETMICRNVFKTLDMTIPDGFQADLTGFVLIYNGTIQIAPRANSDIVALQMPQVATPTFTPEGGAYDANQLNIEIHCATADALVFYTIDGSEPNENSLSYNAPISLAANDTIIIKAIAYKEGMTSSEIATAEYSITSAIQEIDGQEIEIFPNPNDGQFTISCNGSHGEYIRIYSEIGKLVYGNYITDNQFIINISDFPQGLYFLQIETKNGIMTKKIIKQ